jgi:hypothetical protein
MDQITIITIKRSLLALSIMMYLTAILSSCDNNSIDLGSHYRYNTEYQYISGHQIGFFYPYIIKNQPKRKDIPPIVIDYKYDNDYIWVKQKPKIPLEQIYYDFNEIIYPLGLDTTYYWIIDKKTGEVMGPLLYKEFYSKCKTCGTNNLINE